MTQWIRLLTVPAADSVPMLPLKVPVISTLVNLMPSFDIHRLLHMCGVHKFMEANANTHTFLKRNKYSLEGNLRIRREIIRN